MRKNGSANLSVGVWSSELEELPKKYAACPKLTSLVAAALEGNYSGVVDLNFLS